jgi:hypothetical protein
VIGNHVSIAAHVRDHTAGSRAAVGAHHPSRRAAPTIRIGIAIPAGWQNLSLPDTEHIDM